MRRRNAALVSEARRSRRRGGLGISGVMVTGNNAIALATATSRLSIPQPDPNRISAALDAAEATLREDCSICIDKKVDRSVLLPCLHTFCYSCISRWVGINPSCPLCKSAADKILHHITEDRRFSEVHVMSIRAAEAARHNFRLAPPDAHTGEPLPSHFLP